MPAEGNLPGTSSSRLFPIIGEEQNMTLYYLLEVCDMRRLTTPAYVQPAGSDLGLNRRWLTTIDRFPRVNILALEEERTKIPTCSR